MNQSAVEFIVKQMQSGKWEYTPNSERAAIIEQAKKMELDLQRKQYQQGYQEGLFASENK